MTTLQDAAKELQGRLELKGTQARDFLTKTQELESSLASRDADLLAKSHALEGCLAKIQELESSLANAQELESSLAARDADLACLRDAADRAESPRCEAEQSLEAAQSAHAENSSLLQSAFDKDKHDKAKLESENTRLQEAVKEFKTQLEALQEFVREREDTVKQTEKDKSQEPQHGVLLQEVEFKKSRLQRTQRSAPPSQLPVGGSSQAAGKARESETLVSANGKEAADESSAEDGAVRGTDGGAADSFGMLMRAQRWLELAKDRQYRPMLVVS